jgi:hypothetical protein
LEEYFKVDYIPNIVFVLVEYKPYKKISPLYYKITDEEEKLKFIDNDINEHCIPIKIKYLMEEKKKFKQCIEER